MADIDTSKYSYNKQFKDRWEIEVDEHDPISKAKKVKLVDGEINIGEVYCNSVTIKDANSDNKAKVNSDGTLDVNLARINAATEEKQNEIITKLDLKNYFTNDVDNLDEFVIFVGKEKKDGTWLILKIDTHNGVVIRGASEKNNADFSDYVSAWTNRTSLSYTYLREVIE